MRSSSQEMRWVKTSQFTWENKEKCRREKSHKRRNCERHLWVKRGKLLWYRIAEATDAEDFTAKLEYFNLRWEVLCPEFFAWFNVKRKPLFLESVIQSSWEKSDINGWYYQNDTESKHAAEKRNQHLAGKHISDLHIMIKMQREWWSSGNIWCRKLCYIQSVQNLASSKSCLALLEWGS